MSSMDCGTQTKEEIKETMAVGEMQRVEIQVLI